MILLVRRKERPCVLGLYRLLAALLQPAGSFRTSRFY
jgi:hypothetical protein